MMVIGLLIRAAAYVGLPESVRRPIALLGTGLAVAALCGLLWTCWLRGHDREVVQRHEWDVKEAVAVESAAASEAASQAAIKTKGTVDDGNTRAREAAAGSDDPLKSGFDRLRGEKRSP